MEFPTGLVVSILGFHCCGLGSVLGWGTEITEITQYAPSQKRHKILIVKNKSKTAHQFSLVHLDNETDYVVANRQTNRHSNQTS